MTYFSGEDAESCTRRSLADIIDSALNARMIFEGSNAERVGAPDPVFTGDPALLDRIEAISTGGVLLTRPTGGPP